MSCSSIAHAKEELSKEQRRGICKGKVRTKEDFTWTTDKVVGKADRA